MHQSFVTTPPPRPGGGGGGGGGDSYANVLCFYFSTVPAVRGGGGCQEFVLYRQKWQRNVKHNCGGKRAMVLSTGPQCWAFRRKVKVPPIPRRLGCVVTKTGALAINMPPFANVLSCIPWSFCSGV